MVKKALELDLELEQISGPSPLQENIIQVKNSLLAVQKNGFKRGLVALPSMSPVHPSPPLRKSGIGITFRVLVDLLLQTHQE